MKLPRLIATVCLLGTALHGAAQSTVPGKINYQGQLVDSSGTPLTNGDYVLSFRVYNQNAPGGTLLWGPARFDGTAGVGHGPPATLVNGQFNLVLDVDTNSTPLGAVLTNNAAAYWLEISINTNNPISPRQQMLSAPLALKSADADQLAGFGWEAVFNNGNPQSGFILGGKLADGSVTSAKLGAGAVGPGQLSAGAVSATNLANQAVGTGQLAPNAVTSTQIASNAVNTAQIANSAVTSAQIASNAVTAIQLGSGAVTAGKIAADAVGTLQITNGAITPAKLNLQTGLVAIGTTPTVYPLDVFSAGGAAVHAVNNGHLVLLAESGDAIYTAGNVIVQGTLSKTAGSFMIDHPLDPANKYLYHSFVESPDMKNIYDGVAVLDARGEAQVDLPEWFGALNKDFRYQLTAIGAPGPNLHVAQEVTRNHFRIAGGPGGLKVSWQVTGIRRDAYANAHRIPVEVNKPADLRGHYLYPEEHGQPAAKSELFVQHPEAAPVRK